MKYPLNEWIHVKIIVSGKNAEVYINDMDNPTLFIEELKRDIKAGKVGLHANVGMPTVPIHFANFSYTSMKTPPQLKTIPESVNVTNTNIASWLVSNTFSDKSLENKFRLTEDDKQKLSWKQLVSESSGLANLAKVQGRKKGKNGVFARATIISDKDQIKRLKFGFSDKVQVYFNDQLLFSGSDVYRSRDYRFLGTIGFYYDLYLPLKKGENELWMAVSEIFGGWGVQARFDDLEGIKIIATD